MTDRKGGDLDGKGGSQKLGRVEGGETVIRIYYMRKKSIFDKRKNCHLKVQIRAMNNCLKCKSL